MNATEIAYREPLETGERVWTLSLRDARVTVEQSGVRLVHEWQDVPEEVREALLRAA